MRAGHICPSEVVWKCWCVWGSVSCALARLKVAMTRILPWHDGLWGRVTTLEFIVIIWPPSLLKRNKCWLQRERKKRHFKECHIDITMRVVSLFTLKFASLWQDKDAAFAHWFGNISQIVAHVPVCIVGVRCSDLYLVTATWSGQIVIPPQGRHVYTHTLQQIKVFYQTKVYVLILGGKGPYRHMKMSEFHIEAFMLWSHDISHLSSIDTLYNFK